MKHSNRTALLNALSPIAAVAFASLVGSVVILTAGKNPIEVYSTMVSFSLTRFDSIALILFRSTPLIFSALAVSLCFKADLFNIGVEGQYLVGAFFAAWAGFSLKGLPAIIHLPVVMLFAMLGGVMWSLVPAFLKIRRGVHEVITTVMMNHIAFSLVHYLVYAFIDKGQQTPAGMGSPRIRTPEFLATARMPTLHSMLNPVLRPFGLELPGHVYLNYFLILGVVLLFVVDYLVRKSPPGLELRAVGHSPEAAETAGIDPRRVRLNTFILSGAIAGLVGLSDLLSYFGYMDIDFPKQYGFTGIAVALLGKGTPLGILLSSVLFSFVKRGAEGAQVFLGVPMDTAIILEGVMILAIVVSSQISGRYILSLQKKEAQAHAD